MVVGQPVLVGAPVDDVDRPLAVLELREQAPAADRELIGRTSGSPRCAAIVACS